MQPAHQGQEEKYQACGEKNPELFYVCRRVCHENKETYRKKTKLTTRFSDNELSGHWSITTPPHCAQWPHRQFLLLLQLTCFFPDTVYSLRTRQSHSLHPTDLFRELWAQRRYMGRGEKMNTVHLLCGKRSVCKNSYLSTVTEVMLALF